VIVWEHNTHVGDARFTDMKKSGMINVGQLVREQQGDANTVLVGFGSYEGTVIAGETWEAAMREMEVPPAKKGSVEYLLHIEMADNRLLIFDRDKKKERFGRVMPHRAIGVVYDPTHERFGNYVPTILNARYDAFIYLDKTSALYPLHLHPHPHKTPETYPFEY
jgi:erythromycin esterase